MAKKLIKRIMPRPESIQNNRYLKIFGKYIYNPNLWHLNRHSTAKAFSIGLFITYLPFPGHMLLAAFLSILLRANLPIAMLLVWVVNPVTMVPMFGFAYIIGALILGQSPQELAWSISLINELWRPVLLGSLICGTCLSICGNLFIRLFWRINVSYQWRKRQKRIPEKVMSA